MTDSYLDQELRRFLDLVAAREPAPGGGSAAAVTVSLAAGLVAMAARYSSRQLPHSEEVVADAERVRRRAAELADADAQAYGAVIAARRAIRTGDAADRRERVRATLEAASLVPLEVAELGAETARLALLVVADGNPTLRGDAATAALLAEAAVRSAAGLVTINVGGGDQELRHRAARSTHLAAEAVRGVEEALLGDGADA